ncbi:MAG: helix-turn-helix domain-containing protein [Bifidobacteriaceae bacterium]|jgi:excisionase family DNA binding protein|nr:helix-turn-helix domain-containing protein [Bifidobacteriaceae bacterium]
MSTPVMTLEPEAVSAAGREPAWRDSLIHFVEHAARSGQTVVVSVETRMLTPDELARRLMVSRSTISRRISAGEIKVVKVGNRNRIPYPEARRLWDEQMDAVAGLVAPDIEAELFGDEE